MPASSSNSSSDAPVSKKAAKKVASKVTKKDTSSCSTDAKPSKTTAVKKTSKSKKSTKKDSSSSEASESEKPKKTPVKKVKADSSDSESSDESPKKRPVDDSDSEEAPPLKKIKTHDGPKPAAKPDFNQPKPDFAADHQLECFVANLPFNVTEDDVWALFEKHGTVQSCKVLPSGVGFVKMSSVAECAVCIEKLHGTDLQGRNMVVRENIPKEKRVAGARTPGAPGARGNKNPDLTVFVGGLPFETDSETLKGVFDECGKINNVRMISNGSCGFIDFDNAEGVTEAIKWNQTQYAGRSLRVNKASDKPPRRS